MTPRARHRTALQCPAVFQADAFVGEGTTLDLAVPGCAIESERCPAIGQYVTVALLVPDESPVLSEVAKVRWIADGKFGVEFLMMSHQDQARLARLVGA